MPAAPEPASAFVEPVAATPTPVATPTPAATPAPAASNPLGDFDMFASPTQGIFHYNFLIKYK